MRAIANTPGPKADRKALAKHYARLQARFACLAYDRMVLLCPWCGTDEFEKAYKSPSERKRHGIEARFCSEKCGAAWDRLFEPKGESSEA